MAGNPVIENCIHERRLETIERRHDLIQEQLKKMEDKFDAKLDMILVQISRVAVLEEKHTSQSAALGRAFEKLGNLQISLDRLEHFKSKAEGMAKMAWIMWSMMGLTITGILVKLFGG